MKRTVLFTVFYLTLALGMAWANTIQGTTNPNTFTQDSINWCQFDCNLAGFRAHSSPTPWESKDLATGTIAAIGVTTPGFVPFYSSKQGPPPLGINWVGNFPSGMGVIYNGYSLNCAVFVPPGTNCPHDDQVQASIKITFGTPVEGVGAYIQGSDFGPFTATIDLFGQNGMPLGSFPADGFSCNVFGVMPGECQNPNEARGLFIGAFGVGPIFAAQFDVVDSAAHDDFAIGTVKTGPPIPEPSSLLLFASSALGVAGVIRRRFNRGMLR